MLLPWLQQRQLEFNTQVLLYMSGERHMRGSLSLLILYAEHLVLKAAVGGVGLFCSSVLATFNGGTHQSCSSGQSQLIVLESEAAMVATSGWLAGTATAAIVAGTPLLPVDDGQGPCISGA